MGHGGGKEGSETGVCQVLGDEHVDSAWGAWGAWGENREVQLTEHTIDCQADASMSTRTRPKNIQYEPNNQSRH